MWPLFFCGSNATDDARGSRDKARSVAESIAQSQLYPVRQAVEYLPTLQPMLDSVRKRLNP